MPAHAALRPSLPRRHSRQSLSTSSRRRAYLYAVHGRQGGHPDAEHSFRGQDAGFIVPPAEYAHMTFEQVRDARFLKKIPTLYEILGEDAVLRIPNPAARLPSFQDMDLYLAAPTDAILKQTVVNPGKPQNFARYLRSGPREHVAFSYDEVRAAIVTCGGICPGINTVIRELTDGLANLYGVQHIYGIRGGYRGFYDGTPYMPLDPRNVDGIHRLGGTVLGTSRGGFDLERILHAIEQHRFNQLYVIGGDGTIKGAAAIAAECERRRRKVGVVSVPKTIDNDIPVIDHSFGFMTAVEEAQRAINAAHVEVTCFPNGIGVVRLMGRNSGFIAMYATLASRDVDCCLIPEVPFDLHGPHGLCAYIQQRLAQNGHFVLVVAEGAGQELVPEVRGADLSGNRKLADIGPFLTAQIEDYFHAIGMEVSMKYIDPTYMVRAIPPIASDQMYCALLAHSAVHGAMAGYTSFTVGPVNGRYAMIPLSDVAGEQQRVSVRDRTWMRLLSSTGQPSVLHNGREAGSSAADGSAAAGRESAAAVRPV